MTQIDFYSDTDDRLHTACRLTAKAVQQGCKVMIYTPDSDTVERLDTLLWTFSPTGFVPHCAVGDKMSDVTPVVLGHQSDNLPHDDVLLNLHTEHPPFFSRFKRLIEITGTMPDEMQAARVRYRFYQERGYEIRHHKIGAV
jgi:DNA polymerase III subunit chi